MAGVRRAVVGGFFFWRRAPGIGAGAGAGPLMREGRLWVACGCDRSVARLSGITVVLVKSRKRAIPLSVGYRLEPVEPQHCYYCTSTPVLVFKFQVTLRRTAMS